MRNLLYILAASTRKALVAALPDMTARVVVPMIAAHVTRQPPVHHRAEGGRGLGLQHEVEVIRHDAEAKQRNGELLLGDREQLTEGTVVGVIVEDGRPSVASVQDMIDVPGDLTTRNARHSGDGTARWNGRARKSSLSPFSACPIFLPPNYVSLSVGLAFLALAEGVDLFVAQHSFAIEAICPGGSNSNANVIFCDDFEDSTALVRPGRYFEYNSNGGDFVPMDGVGLNNSRGMRGLWQQGEVDGGNIKLAFGRNPGSGMNKGIRTTEDFREIYYRMYLKMQPGWVGDPGKLSRATSIVASDWSQAMIAHLWGDGSNHLLIDPVSCIGTDNLPKCVGYNDFVNITWLGNQSGGTPIFNTSNSSRWFCIEHHVKLNDPGQSNGIQEFWIDGQLEARRASLNFVGSYTAYGINAVFLENWWNAGSVQQQERYFDNFVVSTQRTGCGGAMENTPPRPPTGLTVQ